MTRAICMRTLDRFSLPLICQTDMTSFTFPFFIRIGVSNVKSVGVKVRLTLGVGLGLWVWFSLGCGLVLNIFLSW